jgi:hypothetical protein
MKTRGDSRMSVIVAGYMISWCLAREIRTRHGSKNPFGKSIALRLDTFVGEIGVVDDGPEDNNDELCPLQTRQSSSFFSLDSGHYMWYDLQPLGFWYLFTLLACRPCFNGTENSKSTRRFTSGLSLASTAHTYSSPSAIEILSWSRTKTLQW